MATVQEIIDASEQQILDLYSEAELTAALRANLELEENFSDLIDLSQEPENSVLNEHPFITISRAVVRLGIKSLAHSMVNTLEADNKKDYTQMFLLMGA